MSLIAEKLAVIGLLQPNWEGVALLATVILVFVMLVAFVARGVKGRSFLVWAGIAALAQALAIIVPLIIAALTGLVEPSDLSPSGSVIDFATFRLFAEMSVVVGITTLIVLSFLTQTKWKTCPACNARAPWNAKSCPACASEFPSSHRAKKRMEPGEQPRLTARTIHIPPELDAKLISLAAPKGRRGKTTVDAAVSRYIRQLLEQFDSESRRKDQDAAE